MINEIYTWAAMGGHGMYVWSVYGISFVVLVALGAWPIRMEKKLIASMTEPTDEHGRP